MQGLHLYILVYKSPNLLLPLCRAAPTAPFRPRLLLVVGRTLKVEVQVVVGVAVAVGV